MLAAILRKAFTLANQRPGLIVVDMLWKLAWIVLTAAALLLAAAWVTSGLQGIAWDDTGVVAVNGLIAAAFLREFWSAHRGEVVVIIFVLLSVSASIWVFLEAFCRRRIVQEAADGSALNAAATYPLKVFLASGILKSGVLFTTASVLLVVFAGARTIAIITFLALAFFLTLLETLIRADAVDLLGTDLIRVAGLLGILMSFEGMVAASFAAILFAGFLNVARAMDAALMSGAAVAGVIFLNILHSYLLLVRFSAIAIMRRNVIEV